MATRQHCDPAVHGEQNVINKGLGNVSGNLDSPWPLLVVVVLIVIVMVIVIVVGVVVVVVVKTRMVAVEVVMASSKPTATGAPPKAS